jgi:MGT family glycosyltransferase
MSYSYLLASWGSSGNMNPLLTAGRQLRRKGHSVRVLADPAMRGEVEAADFEFISWTRAPFGIDADPMDFSDIKEWMRQALFDPTAAYAADTQDELRRVPTDAVLCIDVLFGAVIAAEALGLPVALLSPHVSIRPLPGVPPASTSLMQPKTAEERAEIAAINDQLLALLNEFLPAFNAARANLGLSPFADMFAIFDRADRVLLATSEAFDFKADSVPGNFRYIGPLLDEPSWSKPWQAPWPAQSARPRVLIAASTGAQGQGGLVQSVISAMATVDADAVLTAGPNLNIEQLTAPPNVHLLPSAPHNAVMKDVSLVVTQGGHGTVNRALISGLPMLILPNGRDQGANAARVESNGAGLQLPPTAAESEIAAAVNRLIKEPHFRAAAKRIGEAIKADIATCALVHEMEMVVEARRKPRRAGRARSVRSTA